MYPSVLHGALSFVDGWTLVEDQLRSADRQTGTLFTTSNGYVGVRGRRREPFGDDDARVLVSGCFETRPYAHPERTFGVPDDYQTLVPVTDPTFVAAVVEGDRLDAASGTWLEHRRALDLRTGCVTTTGTWCSPAGARVSVRTRRLASLVHPALVWTVVELEPAAGSVDVEVTLSMRANTATQTFPDEPEALGRAHGRVLRPRGSLDDGELVGLVQATAFSGRAVACVAGATGTGERVEADAATDEAWSRFAGRAAPGSPLVVCQRAAFADGDAADATAVLDAAAAAARRWRAATFDEVVAQQRERLDGFWLAAAVDLDGDPETEAAVRFSTFQVFQARAANPGRACAAKGLTGQGYEGHHLWDQEVYVGHALTLLAPDATRAALGFRCRTLPAARARAARLSHAGAQFPWRTIDGREASAFFPAGAAQYHVNGDIAWAIDHYVTCTGDERFLLEGGLDVLVETARFWPSIGRFRDDGRFAIEGVTGPDEYTALVDNNLFTNLMAAHNLESAADHLDRLRARDRRAFDDLAAALALADDEPARWREAAAAMVVPYDDELGVHGQDDSFLQLPRWDLAATPEDELPLQDHHHLLTLYRHQVLKQADVVLALFLLADRFTAEERRRDFDHYEPLTTHDSSLSAPVHAVVAVDVGRPDLGWRYLRDAAFGDLEDRHGTLGDGLHLAAAAGAWSAVACGFGGFTVRDGVPGFGPRLPPGVTRLRFAVRFRGSVIEVDTDAGGTSYRVLDGGAVTLEHRDGGGGRPVRLTVAADAPGRAPAR